MLSAKHSHKHKKETSVNIDCALNHCPVSFCEIGASVVDVFLVVVNIIPLVFQVFFLSGIRVRFLFTTDKHQPSEEEALLEELAIMAGIKPHPNIVNLLGCCTTPGDLFSFFS